MPFVVDRKVVMRRKTVYICKYVPCCHVVPVSVYKRVNEPIQHNTAVHYHRWLLWTSTNIRRYQTDTHFNYIPLEAKCSLSLVVAVWMCLVVCWRCWKGRGRTNISAVGKGLSNLIDRMASRILSLLKAKQPVSHFIFQTVLTYHLSSLLFAIAKIAGHLTTISRYCRWLCITHRELCNDELHRAESFLRS